MTGKLMKKHVAVKLADKTTIQGTVYEETALGVWIVVASNSEIRNQPGVPNTIQHPIFFVPFSQMLWLMTSGPNPMER